MWLLTLHQVHAKVVALNAHKLRITAVACTCSHKDWSTISRTKGLEIVQMTLELESAIEKLQEAEGIPAEPEDGADSL